MQQQNSNNYIGYVKNFNFRFDSRYIFLFVCGQIILPLYSGFHRQYGIWSKSRATVDLKFVWVVCENLQYESSWEIHMIWNEFYH